MGKLVFRVASDWQEVVRLRTEIEKLKQTLFSMDSTQSPDTFKKLNAQLGENSKKMNTLIYDAAKAGATMENDFKKGIYDGEKAVNSLSEEIIKQKNIIRETQNDVSMLTEQYKKLGKYDPKRQSLSDELNRAKAALGEQKYALGELQSQQALARLSTKALKDEYALFKDESRAVINVNEGVGVSFKKTLAAIGGIAMLKQVASNVVSTAGMFQKYESVLTNALNGSSEKAKAYLSAIKSFAAKTNFQLDELTDDFIKFVNRGVTPSMDAMKKMGDFTNTVAKPFDQLTEAILDINNPERWKEFGVRVQTEGNKVKLSFRDMTVECDRTVESVMKAVEQFGSMKGVEGSTEAIAKTIEGQMSNLEDTITTALAEIGLANQDLISGSISAVDTIVKNYDIIGKSVLALIEIYGVYRAGLLINTIVEQGSVKSIWAKITATKAATVAQVAYNKVLAMNPYVAVGMAVVSLGVAVYTLAEHTTYAEKTARSAAESMEKMKNASENLKNKINELLSVIRDETSTQYKKTDAYLKLQNILPEVFKNMDIEKIKLMDKLSLLEKINKASDRREIVGAKTSVVLAQKEVDKINALIAADSQRGTYSGQYEIQLSDAKSKLEAAKKVVADIEKIQVEANKQKEKDDKKVVVKNKEYWTNQKKEAETALNSIASSQKKLMDAGKFEGIDTAVVKSYKGNVKKLKEAEKELKVYDSSSKQDNQTEKLRKQTDKYNALLDKQSLEQQRSTEDLQMEVDEARIKAMDEGSAKTIAEMELNFEKEMQAIDRQKEDALRKKVEDARAAWEANPKNKGKSFDSTDIELSDDENKYYDALYKAAVLNNEKIYSNLANEYLSYTDERLAIEKKFNDDIAVLQEARKKAESKGNMDEVAKIDRSIEKRIETKNEDIFKLDAEQFKKNMNWEQVFGNLDKVSTDTLKKLKVNLKDFISSQKDLSPENLKELVDAIERIDDKVSERNPLEAMSVSFKSLKEATDAQCEAQEAYNKALEEGTDEEKKNAKATLESAKNSKQKALYEATDALHKGINEIGQYVDAGNQVIGIMETLGTKTPEWLEGTMSGFGEMLNGLGNIDLMKPMSIITGSLQTVKGALTSVISLGGLIPGFGGTDYSHYNEMVEEYNKLYEIWDELIDKKLEYIGISYGIEADKVGEEALSLVEKQIEAYRLLGKERLNSGASAGSHSIGKRMAKNTSSSDWQDIADALDMSVNAAKEFIGTGRMTGLFDLTVEQLEKLKSEAPAFWAKMDGDVQEYLNGIIDGEERIEDIQNQISEQLTQTTFDSVFDSFVDTLMDMGSSAKDFSDSFSGYMQRAVLTTMVGNKFTEDLQTWYDAFAQANKDQGGITKEEMEALRKQYDAIAGSALAERDKLAEIFGWTKEDTDSSTDNYEDFIGSMQSSLTSLDVTAKDVSDNIYDYFRQAMINALYEKEYKSKMEELYKTFEGLSKDGLSESDMVQLGSRIDQYIEQMMKGVEDVNSLFADKLKNAEDLQSFVDSVKSAMSSVEATAEDVTDNIFEYIRQQMVDKMFTDSFQPQIKELYKKVQEAMSDGDITGAEKDALRNEAEKLANDITAAKDILSNTLGITESNLKKELEEEFKSFSDGILSSLYDTEVTAETVAKNISDSMRKELIEAMYLEQYEPRIKAIWEKWKEYSEDGLVTDEERTNIKNDIDGLSKEVADAAGEISDAWKDSGEEVRKAFNSFSDSIKSVLYDAEATAEDIADNIYQYMRNALVDSMFTAQLQPQIQAWYDKYTEFMKDGAIDTAERKTLDEMIAEIQKAGVDIVDAANKLFPTLDTGAINRAEEAAQEAENARNEAEQEWESFSDGILNSLCDIEATAEDISDDMSEYMRKALIKAMYVENFKPQMQKWYNEWKKAMGDDDLTSEEKQLLDSMKQTMVDDMKKEVDAINQFFGTMFSQQASSKGFEAMSQDTSEELNGRFTALQVAGEEIKNQSIQQTGLLSSINGKLSLLNLRSGDVPALLSGTPNFADRAKETIASGYQSQVHVVFPTEDIKALTDKVSNMERIVDEMRTFQVEGNMDRRDILENSVILAKNSPRILDNTNDIKQDIKNL